MFVPLSTDPSQNGHGKNMYPKDKLLVLKDKVMNLNCLNPKKQGWEC